MQETLEKPDTAEPGALGDSLEQKVRRIKVPRTGKLLGRLRPRTKTFYMELVTLRQEFVTALNAYLNSKRGNQKALLGATGIPWDTVKSYSEAQNVPRLIPLNNYNATLAFISSNGWRSLTEGLERSPVPEMVTGFYIPRLLAWYFDSANEETRRLKSPMFVATQLLIEKLEQTDEKFAARQLWLKEDTARDHLIGRNCQIHFPLMIFYEDEVLKSLGLAYLNQEEKDSVRPELREALRQAGNENLETAVEAGLASFAKAQRGKVPKPYRFTEGMTPPGVDYYPDDRIAHPEFGIGKVLSSTAGSIKVMFERRINGEEDGAVKSLIVRHEP